MTFYEYKIAKQKQPLKARSKVILDHNMLALGLGSLGLGAGIGYAISNHLAPKILSIEAGIIGAYAGVGIAKILYSNKHKKELQENIRTRRLNNDRYPIKWRHAAIGASAGGLGSSAALLMIRKIRHLYKGQQTLNEAKHIIGRYGKLGVDTKDSTAHSAIGKYAQSQSYAYPQSQPRSYVDQANVEGLRKQLLKKYKMDTLKSRALTTAVGLGTGAEMGLLYSKYRGAMGKALKHKRGVIGGLALLGGIGANKIFSAGQTIIKKYMDGG